MDMVKVIAVANLAMESSAKVMEALADPAVSGMAVSHIDASVWSGDYRTELYVLITSVIGAVDILTVEVESAQTDDPMHDLVARFQSQVPMLEELRDQVRTRVQPTLH